MHGRPPGAVRRAARRHDRSGCRAHVAGVGGDRSDDRDVGQPQGRREGAARHRADGRQRGAATRTSPATGSGCRPDRSSSRGRRRPGCSSTRSGVRRPRSTEPSTWSTRTPASGCSVSPRCLRRVGRRASRRRVRRSQDASVNLAGRAATIVRGEVGAWRAGGERVDVVIADPARSGLGKPGSAALAAAGAPVLVLVSCDPVSLARDAALLRRHGYRHERTEVLDLFPMTHHVEAVTRFVAVSHDDERPRRAKHWHTDAVLQPKVSDEVATRVVRRRRRRRPRIDDLLEPRVAVAGQRRGARHVAPAPSASVARCPRSPPCSTASHASDSTRPNTTASSVRRARPPNVTSRSRSRSSGRSVRPPSRPRSRSPPRSASRCSPPAGSAACTGVPS